MLVAAGIMNSCGSDNDIVSDGTGDNNPQNKKMVGTKWTTTNWDYSIGDDWVGTLDETYNIYFYSQTEGIFYYGRKDLDSDFGSSSSRCVAHFTYNVDGNIVRLDYINNPMNFSNTLNLAGNTISMNGISFKKGTINSSDKTWLNTLQGTTGQCKWYYDLVRTLYVKGSGDMANYNSFSDTPWGKNDRIPNSVEIQEGVTSIGAYAFANPSIGDLELPHNLSKIGSNAFSGCSIGSVYLYDVKELGEFAFYGCNYATIHFYDEIEIIGGGACLNCKSVSLSMTPNLRYIGEGAFGGKCEVKSWTDSKVLEYIGGAAIGKVNTKELDLPAIKELGHIAFQDTRITQIHIGPNLQKVTGTPFYCASSGTVAIDINTPLDLKYDFVNEEYVKKWNLVVPTGSEEKYWSASYWSNFKSINGQSDMVIIETGEAIVGENGIQLFGSIRGNAKNGNVYFEISRSPTFSDKNVITSFLPVSQITNKFFDITYSNYLKPNTLYYYRAVYLNGSDHTYGETESFTTLDRSAPVILSYTIAGETYKMIRVSGGPNGDFYMMETELPHSLDLHVAGVSIPRLDKSGEGVIFKSEWRTFIDDLRTKTGIEWRLPTPEEWMFAAKGGNESNGTRYAGSNTISDVAWYSSNSNNIVHDVAQKQPNELGFYDMSGNYAELTYGKDLYDIDDACYGGCWNDGSSACTVTSFKPGSVSGNVAGTKYKEKNAFNGKYITVRLVYSAE